MSLVQDKVTIRKVPEELGVPGHRWAVRCCIPPCTGGGYLAASHRAALNLALRHLAQTRAHREG